MKKLWIGLFCMLAMQATGLFAASGLLSSNRVDVEVTMPKTNKTENVTCVQDAMDPKQWYYVSNKPRVAENKKGEPLFMLISYQKNRKQGIDEDGGFLQAAINLSLDSKVLDQIKAGIAKTEEKLEAKRIKLAPLDMKSAKITVYAPGGEKMASDVAVPTIGPSFANEAIPLQMSLNNLGVPVVDALLKGTGGLNVVYQFDYDALTPECSLRVTADWDQFFKHFSTDSAAMASYGGLFFSGSAQASVGTVREQLEKSGCIKVEVIGGDTLKEEEINKYLEPLIEQLNKSIFDIKEPDKIEPAKAKDIQAGKGKFNVGLSFALKSVEQRKTGKHVFDMRKRQILTRSTVVGGIVGLSDYSDEIRKNAILTVDPTYWKSAYYSLPTIGRSLSGLDEIALTVQITHKGKQAQGTEQQLAKWIPKTGWVDVDGYEIISLMFPLKYFYDNNLDKSKNFTDEVQYKQSFEITYMERNNTKIKKFTDTLPAFTGDIPISSPMVGYTYIELDAEGDELTWNRSAFDHEAYKDIKSDLSKITVTMETTNPSNKGAATLTQRNNYANFWFTNDKNGNLPPVKATITYHTPKFAKALETKDQKTIVIESNNALEAGPSLEFMDYDYLPAEKPASIKK